MTTDSKKDHAEFHGTGGSYHIDEHGKKTLVHQTQAAHTAQEKEPDSVETDEKATRKGKR